MTSSEPPASGDTRTSNEHACGNQLDSRSEGCGLGEPDPAGAAKPVLGPGPGGHQTQSERDSSFPTCPRVTPPAQPISRNTT